MVPELETLVNAFVCSGAECAGLMVGSPEHQERVVETYMDLAGAFDVRHGEGYVLRALLWSDLMTAKELAMGFDLYNASLDLIHEAMRRIPDTNFFRT